MGFLSVIEAAEKLGVQPSTVKRYVRKGMIPAMRLGGSTGPLRIDPQALAKVLSGVRTTVVCADAFEKFGPRNPSETAQFDELNRRCMKLAEAIGPEKIIHILKGFGVGRLDDLHPRYYASFRGKLLRLCMSPIWQPPKKRKAA